MGLADIRLSEIYCSSVALSQFFMLAFGVFGVFSEVFFLNRQIPPFDFWQRQSVLRALPEFFRHNATYRTTFSIFSGKKFSKRFFQIKCLVF